MRTRKRSIADLMWIVLIAAFVLWLARGGPEVHRLGQYAAFLLMGGWVLIWVWFNLVPRWSLTLAGGDRGRQRRILTWVVRTPFPGGLKLLPRYILALIDQVDRRFDEAEAVYRAILRDNGRGLLPGFESLLRQRLADTVEALGRPEEAADEREWAAAVLGGDEHSPLGLQARALLLERQHRYAEAAAVYEQALELPPSQQIRSDGQILWKLVFTTYQAGRPADTLRWAEALIAFERETPRSLRARLMAALACRDLGRPEEAEDHARVVAERAQSAEDRAGALALLAGAAMRAGRLDEAERMAREADAFAPNQRRTAWLVIAGIERERGRLEEAIRALEHARTIVVGHIPAAIRRLDAVVDQGVAINLAELGRRDEARERMAIARAELGGDEKLGVVADGAAALVHALIGDRDEALDAVESAESRRQAVSEDLTTQKAVLALLGWAALAIDEPGRAERLLRELLGLGPSPLNGPFIWYQIGECRRRFGDEAGGRDCDEKAASTSFGSRWERLARERLAREGATP